MIYDALSVTTAPLMMMRRVHLWKRTRCYCSVQVVIVLRFAVHHSIPFFLVLLLSLLVEGIGDYSLLIVSGRSWGGGKDGGVEGEC